MATSRNNRSDHQQLPNARILRRVAYTFVDGATWPLDLANFLGWSNTSAQQYTRRRTVNVARRNGRKYPIVYNGSETSVDHICRMPTPMGCNKQTQKSTLRFHAQEMTPSVRKGTKRSQEVKGIVEWGRDSAEYLCRVAVVAHGRPLIYLTNFGLSVGARWWMRVP